VNVISTILQGVGIWIGAQYILGPFLVKLRARAPARYSLPKLDWSELLSSSGEPFQQNHRQLLDLGFAAASATGIPNIKAVMYVHPHDSAMVELRHTRLFDSVCFIQAYADGTRLLFGNTPLAAVYPRWEKEVGFNFSNCRDIAVVFEKFKTIRAKLSLGQPISVSANDVLQSTEDYLNAQLDYLVEQGYYCAPDPGGTRPITLKGACLMTWRSAWPSKPIAMFLARRRAERAANSGP
jgi:hypothetical protein